MKTALVTGATSYLGRELCRKLAAEGVAVHAVVRPGSDLSRLRDVRPVLHVHDGETETMASLVAAAQPDVVFHLATLYVREHKPEQIAPLIASNILFGTQLLDAMRRAGARRIVAAGSAFQHFEHDGYRPLNLYAATKQAFEDVLAYYRDAAGIEAVTLVLYEVYGPGDWRKKFLAAVRDAQKSAGTLPLPAEDSVLDLVYVDDVVAAFLRAAALLESGASGVAGERFAVSGARHRLSEVIAAFEAEGGKSIATGWGAYQSPERNIATPWRGPSLPGWQAKVDLREGVRRFLAGR
jgi:nucleoside-diphosphate-sugar epimerase